MSHRPQNGFNYILNCVDVCTRKLRCRIMKKKDAPTLMKTFQSLFQEAKPKKIWSDQESGLTGGEFKSFLKRENIILYHTHSASHSVIVERINRTMKENMEKHVGNDWVKFVTDFMQVYNDTKHSSINVTPNEAYNTIEGFTEAMKHNVENYNRPRKEAKDKLKVGSRVRIQIRKGALEKGYKQRYSTQIYIITKVLDTNPTTYNVVRETDDEEIIGAFYRQELVKAKSGPLPKPGEKEEMYLDDDEDEIKRKTKSNKKKTVTTEDDIDDALAFFA